MDFNLFASAPKTWKGCVSVGGKVHNNWQMYSFVYVVAEAISSLYLASVT